MFLLVRCRFLRIHNLFSKGTSMASWMINCLHLPRSPSTRLPFGFIRGRNADCYTAILHRPHTCMHIVCIIDSRLKDRISQGCIFKYMSFCNHGHGCSPSFFHLRLDSQGQHPFGIEFRLLPWNQRIGMQGWNTWKSWNQIIGKHRNYRWLSL